LGIYHGDLKPENVLCFNGGLRLAITDFGIATTEKVSEEFRTGSVHHMSPGTSPPFLCIPSRRTNARSRMSRWKLCPQWDVLTALQGHMVAWYYSSQSHYWAQSMEIGFILGSNISGVPARAREVPPQRSSDFCRGQRDSSTDTRHRLA
jgi:serine/threonine protein kinase